MTETVNLANIYICVLCVNKAIKVRNHISRLNKCLFLSEVILSFLVTFLIVQNNTTINVSFPQTNVRKRKNETVTLSQKHKYAKTLTLQVKKKTVKTKLTLLRANYIKLLLEV